MLYDNVDRVSVEKMVRTFYPLVLKDELLGPFFIRAFGNDIKNDKWYEHLRTLDNFWLLMMTGERNGYWGDPFPPHAFLGDLSRETFERWLEIFHGVVSSLFIPEIATKFHDKASVLAEQFMENLHDEDDE